jgi:hypothetical protein
VSRGCTQATSQSDWLRKHILFIDSRFLEFICFSIIKKNEIAFIKQHYI